MRGQCLEISSYDRGGSKPKSLVSDQNEPGLSPALPLQRGKNSALSRFISAARTGREFSHTGLQNQLLGGSEIRLVTGFFGNFPAFSAGAAELGVAGDVTATAAFGPVDTSATA